MSTQTDTVIQVGAIGIRFLVDADDSKGAATVFECSVPVGAKSPCRTATTRSRRPSTG